MIIRVLCLVFIHWISVLRGSFCSTVIYRIIHEPIDCRSQFVCENSPRNSAVTGLLFPMWFQFIASSWGTFLDWICWYAQKDWLLNRFVCLTSTSTGSVDIECVTLLNKQFQIRSPIQVRFWWVMWWRNTWILKIRNSWWNFFGQVRRPKTRTKTRFYAVRFVIW